VFLAHPCYISLNGDVKFISSPSQNLSPITLACYKYCITTLVCSISRITLNEDRIFFCTEQVNSSDVGLRIICLEAQILVEKQSSFKVSFSTQIGHRPSSQTQNEGPTRTYKKNRVALWLFYGCNMTLTQRRRYLKLIII